MYHCLVEIHIPLSYFYYIGTYKAHEQVFLEFDIPWRKKAFPVELGSFVHVLKSHFHERY